MKKMRQRTISDYFWRDPKLCNLTQEDKATLLFFLTSPSSNIIGVYQVVWAIAGAEMGWTKDQLLGVAKRLRDRGLINFNDEGWIFVKIWWEHNSAAGAFSPKLIKSAKEQCEAMPTEWQVEFLTIIDSLKLTGINSVSIGYPYSIDTLPTNTTTGISINTTTTNNAELHACNKDAEVRQLPKPTLDTASDSGVFELIYPDGLSHDEQKAVQGMVLVGAFPLLLQQQLLDEVAGAIQVRAIKRGIVPFAHGCVSAAKKGGFTPSLGVAVLAARKTALVGQAKEILANAKFEFNPESQKKGEQIIAAVRNRAVQAVPTAKHS